jgi:hypothetical protein
VAAFVKDRFGVGVWPQTGWQWLTGLVFRLVVPRPGIPRRPRLSSRRCGFHGLRERLAGLRRERPDRDVEL